MRRKQPEVDRRPAAEPRRESRSAAVNLDTVRALAEIAERFDLGEIRYAVGGAEVVVRRRGDARAADVASVGLPAPPPAVAAGRSCVRSPFVGTFFRAAQPGAAPFVEVGQRVRRGQVLCIVEAMKLMNEIEAEDDGVVVACRAADGRAVALGQPLFELQAD